MTYSMIGRYIYVVHPVGGISNDIDCFHEFKTMHNDKHNHFHPSHVPNDQHLKKTYNSANRYSSNGNVAFDRVSAIHNE